MRAFAPFQKKCRYGIMMSLQDNPGRANAAGLMRAAASGLALRWKRAPRPIGGRMKFVLLLFKLRKLCDGSRNGDKGSRSFVKRADVGAYRGKPGGTAAGRRQRRARCSRSTQRSATVKVAVRSPSAEGRSNDRGGDRPCKNAFTLSCGGLPGLPIGRVRVAPQVLMAAINGWTPKMEIILLRL
jgi:hypothetical protein